MYLEEAETVAIFAMTAQAVRVGHWRSHWTCKVVGSSLSLSLSGSFGWTFPVSQQLREGDEGQETSKGRISDIGCQLKLTKLS